MTSKLEKLVASPGGLYLPTSVKFKVVSSGSFPLFLGKEYLVLRGFPGGSVVKNSPTNEGDADLIPGSGRSPGGGNSNPLQYSCWNNPMDRGAWRATVHGITKSQTQLSMHAPSIYLLPRLISLTSLL